MLVALKSARDVLTQMSYKGFEIRDDKDYCKCLLSIAIDYFGSIFHDHSNQQQDTVFHHLSQGICFTLGDKLKNETDTETLASGEENGESGNGDSSKEREKVPTRERCQSSSSVSSCFKLLEPNNSDSLGFEELNISFDITSLSYAYSILNRSSHVIFLDIQKVYPLESDLVFRYIYYRSDDQSDHHGDNQLPVSDKSSVLSLPCQRSGESEDKIEIHRFPPLFDDDSNESTCKSSLSLISLPISVNDKSTNLNHQSLLRSILIPSSKLINIELGQQYCLLYLNGEESILGRSEPFIFDIKLINNQITTKSADDDANDSDEDGFVIVES